MDIPRLGNPWEDLNNFMKQDSEINRAKLTMLRVEADKRIRNQIETGKEFLNLSFNSKERFDEALNEMYKWDDYNEELLGRIVDNDELVNDYTRSFGLFSFGSETLIEGIRDFYNDVKYSIRKLESILNRLDLIPESSSFTKHNVAKEIEKDLTSDRIFIVHGHDQEAKETVARFIEKLELHPIILHEQPNEGRTIIEKFEDHSEVGYAIVLLTPDDIGAQKTDAPQYKDRARQNVILELGFFFGKLGRERVCALHKGDVELPTDFSGVLWIHMDKSGSWKLNVAKEIKAAGLGIDLNKLI